MGHGTTRPNDGRTGGSSISRCVGVIAGSSACASPCNRQSIDHAWLAPAANICHKICALCSSQMPCRYLPIQWLSTHCIMCTKQCE
jgi:hypothetical protein